MGEQKTQWTFRETQMHVSFTPWQTPTLSGLRTQTQTTHTHTDTDTQNQENKIEPSYPSLVLFLFQRTPLTRKRSTYFHRIINDTVQRCVHMSTLTTLLMFSTTICETSVFLHIHGLQTASHKPRKLPTKKNKISFLDKCLNMTSSMYKPNKHDDHFWTQKYECTQLSEKE